MIDSKARFDAALEAEESGIGRVKVKEGLDKFSVDATALEAWVRERISRRV